MKRDGRIRTLMPKDEEIGVSERPRSKIFDVLPWAYFREAAETFARAVARAGMDGESRLRIAGINFRLRFAGETASRLILPSLAHLVCREAAPADWTIHCWDDATTGSALPMPTPWMRTNHLRDCLNNVSDRTFTAFYQEWMQTFMFIDRQGREAYCCYLNAAKLPMYEKAAPMRQIFNTAFNLRGRQIVHAAAVGSPRGSVLLAGAPRSGKSTLAVQCLLHGMDFQSDDLCVISEDDPPLSWSLYNVAKLREDCAPAAKAQVPLTFFTEGQERKSFFHVDQIFPKSILQEAPIKALVLPRITNEAVSRLRPATRFEAMRAVIPWSVSEVPTSDNFGEKIMLRAISRFPAYYHLELGRDEKQACALLRSLIDES